MSTTDPREFAQNYFSLTHEYDPVAAREYYLRTRQLKGRKKGDGDDKSSDSESSKRVASDQKKLPAPVKQPASDMERKAEAQRRVQEIVDRLNKLQNQMAKLVEQAKARSGVETDSKDKSPTKASSTSSKGKTTDSKPRTAAQKRADAKRSKERREKDGDQHLTAQAKETQALEAKVTAVLEKIRKLQEQLVAARKHALNDPTARTAVTEK